MRGLERRVRDEARKIAAKYIFPPATVEFAVLYLPTDALHAEIARIPGLIDAIGREHRVLVMGPTLFPALLRTIHLGFVTLALEDKADEIRDLLGVTRAEMLKMDDVLERLRARPARSAARSSGRVCAPARSAASCVTLAFPPADVAGDRMPTAERRMPDAAGAAHPVVPRPGRRDLTCAPAMSAAGHGARRRSCLTRGSHDGMIRRPGNAAGPAGPCARRRIMTEW